MSLVHRHEIKDILMTVLDAEHAEGIVEHRKKTIRKPFTAFAAKLLAKEFAKCPDPNAAAEEMILRGWQGFKAEWMRKVEPRAYYQRNADQAHAEMHRILFEEPSHGADSYPADYSRRH